MNDNKVKPGANFPEERSTKSYNNRNSGYNYNKGGHQNDKKEPPYKEPILSLDQKELFGDIAQEMANSISNTSSTQIRAFFAEVCRLRNKAQYAKNFNTEVLPFLAKLKSDLHYRKEKDAVKENFVKMLTDCIKQVKDKNSLNLFKLFFESVVGFGKNK